MANVKPAFLRAWLAGPLLVLALIVTGAATAAPARPQGPCDIYGAAGDPCVAAHSTTRALYAAYNGPLYQVMRQSDGKMRNIGVIPASSSDPGGYADAAAQDRFCANTVCWIATIYDQSPKHNDLVQPPRGAFSGPGLGGLSNLPIADMAPVTLMGHKVYGVFFMPGMGLRQNDTRGTAVGDQAEGQYWVINGQHYNSGCCFDYGNTEIDSRADGDGTMETTYFGAATDWYHGTAPGPWIMTDQEHNLAGCVTADLVSKTCENLPSIGWRFVTAVAKGEPHHWTTLGGDAQRGGLVTMFDGPRIDSTYDPMRKQGGIVLGNGGDNSNAAQGTFYEGAMTAAGTFPTDATDRLVQANVVAARYNVQRLSLTPAALAAAPPGLQRFAPGIAQDANVTFTNIGTEPVTGLGLSIAVPKQWAASPSVKTFAGPVAPGASVSATFKVTPGAVAFNGDLTAHAAWKNAAGIRQSETAAEKIRNSAPVRINEFRTGGPGNATNAFIELYNAGSRPADISHWTLTQHQAQQAIFSAVTIPTKTSLAPHGFYLLGLSGSGLAAAASAGDATIHVRSISGMSASDTIVIGTGADVETRKIVHVGTAAGTPTTVWQPLPDGPVITIAPGATNVPVASTAGFAVGEKIALGYGASFPAVGRSIEKYEIATVTAIGKPGTAAFLAMDALAGAANIKVTSVANISAGEKIRLDIASMGHGIETVAVTHVGTAANRMMLSAATTAGATNIKFGAVPGTQGGAPFAVGDKLFVGTPANGEVVTVTAIGTSGASGAGIDVTPALAHAHGNGEDLIAPGTGLDLTAPLKFNHAANLPFSVRGTGISFAPASAFAHSSDEPVQPLGGGITLDRPLATTHQIDAVVQSAANSTTGYRGAPEPNQWFGGPVLSPSAGAMVLRDATGLVMDSLNYGLVVDPWAAQGYQGVSGVGQSGCRVTVPASSLGGGRGAAAIAVDRSAGRFPDGLDNGSNCSDFRVQPATTLTAASPAAATNIKVASTADFAVGQTVLLDSGANQEPAVIAAVGGAGGTRIATKAEEGATLIRVGSVAGFSAGQSITIDSGVTKESATILLTASGRGGARITLSAPLRFAHSTSAQVSGTGITFAAALKQAHASGVLVTSGSPTPGAPNRY